MERPPAVEPARAPAPSAAESLPALELLQDRKARAAGKRQLLSLNALDISRTRLAPFRGAEPNEPLTAPWSSYALDDPAVKTAYLAYVRRVADLLEPDYLQTGIEVNLLRRDTDAPTWASFVELQCFVYQELKAAGYPQPISVSLVSTSFYHPELYEPSSVLDEQLSALADLEPCVDVVAWSVYPYLSGLLADSLPEGHFAELLALSAKPQAISESGYPAQEWQLDGLTWHGTPERQLEFADQMLSAAVLHELRFVVWFTVRDYDAFWARPVSKYGLGSDPVALLWRDTGMFDEAGQVRPALERWREALALERP